MKVKLGELTKIRTGKLDANASSPDGEYPFFTCSKEPLKISSYSYDCECVLVAGNGDLNVKYYNGKFDAYQRTYIIEDNSNGRLYLPYLYYFMNGYVEELRKLSIGGVIKYIKLRNLTDALIELPDIETQKYIVSILSKIKELIDSRYQELKILENLIKARFVEMFGDNQEVHKLSDIAAITGGLTKNSRRDKIELRKPYLRVANVFFASIDTTEILDIGLTKEEYEKTLLRNGDLLFVEGNGSPDQIGRVAIWNGEIEDCVHQNHLIKARFDLKRMNPVFAMYYFISERGRNQIKKRAVSTSGLYTLSVSKIADFEIPNPPMELQQQFAAFVAAIDKSKATVQKALDETQLLFDSLMQQYFG